MKLPTKPSAFYVENYLSGFINDPVSRGFAPEDSEDKEALASMGVKVKEQDTIVESEAAFLEKPRYVK